jgi:hypothetical protein
MFVTDLYFMPNYSESPFFFTYAITMVSLVFMYTVEYYRSTLALEERMNQLESYTKVRFAVLHHSMSPTEAEAEAEPEVEVELQPEPEPQPQPQPKSRVRKHTRLYRRLEKAMAAATLGENPVLQGLIEEARQKGVPSTDTRLVDAISRLEALRA